MPEKLLKIVITGAESTGKSSLAQSLASYYNCVWIPEFARSYIEGLDHNYSYDDVETIAREQVEQEKQISEGLVLFDTWIIITKVWFDFVYGKHPAWIDKHIGESKIDLFLLCDIDLPWVADPVRENGGENRKVLHETYKNEITNCGYTYRVVNGFGQDRIDKAIKFIDKILKNNGSPILQ